MLANFSGRRRVGGQGEIINFKCIYLHTKLDLRIWRKVDVVMLILDGLRFLKCALENMPIWMAEGTLGHMKLIGMEIEEELI